MVRVQPANYDDGRRPGAHRGALQLNSPLTPSSRVGRLGDPFRCWVIIYSSRALRKQVPANHRPHSFARNVHRQASAVQHRKGPVSVEQHVKSPLQPIIDFFKRGWRLSGVAVRLATANMCAAMIWLARTEPFHLVRSSMSLMNGPGNPSWSVSEIADLQAWKNYKSNSNGCERTWVRPARWYCTGDA